MLDIEWQVNYCKTISRSNAYKVAGKLSLCYKMSLNHTFLLKSNVFTLLKSDFLCTVYLWQVKDVTWCVTRQVGWDMRGWWSVWRHTDRCNGSNQGCHMGVPCSCSRRSRAALQLRNNDGTHRWSWKLRSQRARSHWIRPGRTNLPWSFQQCRPSRCQFHSWGDPTVFHAELVRPWYTGTPW